MIRPHVKGQITLAESSTVGEIGIAFQNYDYYKLQDPYDLAIVDLNTDDTEKIELVDRNNKTWNARISRTLVKSDYIISVCPPKAHNKIGYTGAINNISFASLHQPKKSLKRFLGIGQDRNDKNYAYDSKKAVHQNIQRIASKLKVRLAVIDAFEIMEGNGPLHGEMVAGHFSIAGTDALSADILTCQCLGLDYNKISYLNLMEPSNPENYFVVGDDWKKNPLSIRQQTN
jgi:uncharacterized protein (DUF362 family)